MGGNTLLKVNSKCCQNA